MKILSIEHSAMGYFADFAIYLVVIVLLPIYLVDFAPAQILSRIALSVLAGLALWSLIEYAMHRLIFHGLEPFQRMHGAHHHHPQALIATPTLVSAALILLLVWLPATLLGGFWLGCGLTLGVTLGYFVYGVVHHAVHHWRARSAWMQQRKLLHAIHHRFPHYNYGVTLSFWDRIFHSRKQQ